MRPLTFATRKDILEYAAHERIPFREDSSNHSTKYFRNKIRLGLIPRIKEMEPNFTVRMEQNIGRLTDTQRFIDHAIELIRNEIVTSEGEIDTLHVDRIDKAFPLNFVIFELMNASYSFKGDVTDALFRALEQGVTGKRFYSKSHVATLDRGKVLITPIAENDMCEGTIAEGAVRGYCGNSALYFEWQDIDTIESRDVPPGVALLDADKLTFPLVVRRWNPGDSFIPFGMEGRKKVSDFLIDEKVSLPEKNRQFVLLSGGEIVWVVGRRIDARYALTRGTENVLRIVREVI